MNDGHIVLLVSQRDTHKGQGVQGVGASPHDLRPVGKFSPLAFVLVLVLLVKCGRVGDGRDGESTCSVGNGVVEGHLGVCSV